MQYTINCIKYALDPIYNAFINNQLMNNVLNVINKILNAIFKLWNNENVIEINMIDISTALTIIVLVLLLYVVIKLFVQMFRAITDSINDIKPKQERFKTGGHKKKKR